MSIGTAVQRGSNWVYVYDEAGRQITTIAGQLYGFTGSTVSVTRGGSWVYVFDEHGRQISTIPMSH